MILGISYFLAVCLGLYGLFVVYATIQLVIDTTRTDIHHLSGPFPEERVLSISVVIPARNEAANIGRCLQSVLAQEYPDFEVILINDHSTDDTAEKAQSIAATDTRLSVIDLKTQTENAYKKAAISQAIARARGEIIVQTDADCKMGPQWLQALSERFALERDLVSGPVQLLHDGGLFQRLQALEHQGLVMLGGGSLLGGLPNMANGANMAYRKAAFEAVGGFTGVDQVASGDDELLLQKLHRAGYRLDFVQDRRAIVRTAALGRWADFAAQRLRWVSKARAYKNRLTNLLQIISYLGFCAFPFWIVSGQWEILALGALGKFAVDTVLMLYAARFFRTFRLLWLLPVLEPLYLAYVLWVGIAGNLVKTYTWKDRTVS